MTKFIFAFFFLGLIPTLSYGQDKKSHKWEVWGRVFRYDLNGDGLLEGLQAVKKDRQDWFYVRDHNNHVLFKGRLQTVGRASRVYRIKINRIGPDLKLLGLYFYDGFSHGDEFYGTSSLYFLTFKQSKLENFKLTQGPSISLEYETSYRYRRRRYKIKLEDLNRNGIKEVVIYYNHIKRVFRYVPGKGMTNAVI
ncbi:MAG: hypothetical protein OXB88_11510 [Bacteriovoracales bacterium]|nr:hypothetical protein [Bacteriovoracales bacterium]